MRLIIDRFEGNFAVCEAEDRKMVNIECSRLPAAAEEGDVIEIEAGDISICAEKTEKRKSEIEKLANELWK